MGICLGLGYLDYRYEKHTTHKDYTMRRFSKSYEKHLALVEELRAQRKFNTGNRGRKSKALKQAEEYLELFNPFTLPHDAILFE
jgi:hypothetical protein